MTSSTFDLDVLANHIEAVIVKDDGVVGIQVRDAAQCVLHVPILAFY